MEKVRLDALLHDMGLALSRERAKAMILAGIVTVDGRVVDKPGSATSRSADIAIKQADHPYVSRGGLKLEKAIKDFNLDFTDRVVLDVGASTGGYTDCALQNGANTVYALDVGYGQLDWKLRNDPRVHSLERTNIRYFTREDLGESVDIVTIDVSFISTALVFPVVKDLIKDEGIIVSLIKPQFEAGKDKVGKNGVVRDPDTHRQVLKACVGYAQKEGLECTGVTFSPITGPKGNIEYFIQLEKNPVQSIEVENRIEAVVLDAHRVLGG